MAVTILVPVSLPVHDNVWWKQSLNDVPNRMSQNRSQSLWYPFDEQHVRLFSKYIYSNVFNDILSAFHTYLSMIEHNIIIRINKQNIFRLKTPRISFRSCGLNQKLTFKSVCVKAISWRTRKRKVNDLSSIARRRNKRKIYISQKDIIDKRYVELDRLDTGYNYFLLKNQRRLNLTDQKQYTYVHNNQTSPVMTRII